MTEEFKEIPTDTTGTIKGVPLMIVGSDEEAESPHLVRVISEALNEAQLFFAGWAERYDPKCVAIGVLFDEEGEMSFHSRETDF